MLRRSVWHQWCDGLLGFFWSEPTWRQNHHRPQDEDDNVMEGPGPGEADEEDEDEAPHNALAQRERVANATSLIQARLEVRCCCCQRHAVQDAPCTQDARAPRRPTAGELAALGCMQAIKSMKQALLKQATEALCMLNSEPEEPKQRGGRHAKAKPGPAGQAGAANALEQLEEQHTGVWGQSAGHARTAVVVGGMDAHYLRLLRSSCTLPNVCAFWHACTHVHGLVRLAKR